MPLAISRAESFEDLVRDSLERLEPRWPQLADIGFTVREVPLDEGRPDALSDGWAHDDSVVPLGGLTTARAGEPPRIMVFRRPVEMRARSRDERALLVHEVVVEQVAELLGLSPESIDPKYGED